MSSTVANLPETFSPPPRGTIAPNNDDDHDQPKSSSLYLYVIPPSLPTDAKGESELTFLQFHVLVDPFLAFGGLNGHRAAIVLAQEAVSDAVGAAAWRYLPSAW